MIYGNMSRGIIKVYPKDIIEISFLEKRGYKTALDGNSWYKILENARYDPFYDGNQIEDFKTIEDYFDKWLLEYLGDEREFFFYVPDGNKFKKTKANTLEEFKKQYQIMIDPNNIKDTMILLNKQTTDSLKSQLYQDYTENRNMIDGFELQDSITIHTIAKQEEHIYYDEDKNEPILSKFNDDFIAIIFMLFVNQIDDTNAIIKELITKLSTIPAVQGTPILDPASATSLNQKLIDDTKIKYDGLNNFTKALKEYYNAKI